MEAVLITRATLAAQAADLWEAQYRSGAYGDRSETTKALRALGPAPDPDAVDAVIGNTSWTEVPECSGCGAKGLQKVVRVGEALNYESATAELCQACVAVAYALITTP